MKDYSCYRHRFLYTTTCSFNGCSSIPLKNRKVKKRINKLLNKEMYLITLKKGIGFKKE